MSIPLLLLVFFLFLVLELIKGKKKQVYTCRKKAEVKQAEAKEYSNHLPASELSFQDPVDQESRHY